MIKLLDGHSLTEKARFNAESMSLTLNQRNSTARMTIGPEAPEITVGEWLQDMDEPGAGIVWRVKTIDDQRETKTRTLVLEHAIKTLGDVLMFGETKPSDMGGGSTCTAVQAIEYILGKQSDWVLGSCTYSVSNPYNFNGDDLFSALETVSSSLEKCWWSYDFSSYPFTISFAPVTETVGVVLRECRNIQTAKITIDRQPMFTRFYPTGKNNLKIDGNYVSKNENIYGRKDKQETDQSKATKAELLRWANERIANHCEPAVTVTVQAIDLSEGTGESLDHIVLGAMCDVPLRQYNTTITETITQINYPDKIREPEVATVTLANIQEDVASIISRLSKSGGGGRRADAKNAEEDHAWFEDTTDHVAMIAEGIAGEGASTDWTRVAELLVDGDGIHQRVTQAQADIVDAYSLIDQTTTAIRLEIGDVQSQVRSFIEQTPEMIHTEVGSAVSGFAQSVIEQTSTYIRMEVENAASEISASVIEQTAEYVRTEVSSVASGVAWSVVTQTMTNIQQQIARKSKVYIQMTDPNDGSNDLYEGDVWIKAQAKKTWNENATTTWNQAAARQWKSLYGDMIYVWRNGAWQFVKDTSVDVENEVKLEQTADGLALIGRSMDASGNVFNSILEVTARQIRSEVSTAENKLNSAIEQTSTYIRSIVNDQVNGLSSVIEQTASQIRTEVSNTVSNLQSSITQQADKISLVVEGTGNNAHIKPAAIVASINNGASTIKLSADHIDIDGIVSSMEAYDVTAGSIEAIGDSTADHFEGVDGHISTDFDVDRDLYVGRNLQVGSYVASWKSKQIVTYNLSDTHAFVYKSGGNEITILGKLVTSSGTSTIYYLGR